MKTHLINFLFIVVCSFSLNAQLQPLPIPIEQFYQNDNNKINNAYFKDVNGLLDKYVGTWEYNQNGHYLKIKFFKQTNIPAHPYNSIFNIQQYYDVIYARFEYKLNGYTVYNTLNQTDNSTKWLIRSTCSSVTSSADKIWLHYKEPSSNPCGRVVSGSVDMEYSNTGGVEKLTWNRADRRSSSSCMDYQTADQTPFQIPANMTLTKIE